MMRAISIRGGKGGADALFVESVPVPEPGPGQLLIRVRAAGVNRPDIFQRAGFYPPPPGAPATLGLEVAGEVAARGRQASRAGGRAIASPRCSAAAATRSTRWWTRATRCPSRGTSTSSTPRRCRRPSSPCGATSSSGASCAQARRCWCTARTAASASRRSRWRRRRARECSPPRVAAAKAGKARELGADLAFDAAAGDWAEPVKAAGGVNVVLDMVGADYFDRNLDVLLPDGRLVVIATLTGHEARLNLRQLMLKRLTVSASTLRARDADGQGAARATPMQEHVWPWIESGAVAGAGGPDVSARAGGRGARLARERLAVRQGGAHGRLNACRLRGPRVSRTPWEIARAPVQFAARACSTAVSAGDS